MKLIHHCTIDSLIKILESEKYYPGPFSRLDGDSGINCFIDGKNYNKSQCFKGQEAEIYFKWNGPVKEVSTNTSFPLGPNVLYNQPSWRAIIPFGTGKSNIAVYDFKITDKKKQSLSQKIRIYILKCKIKKGPIYLQIEISTNRNA